PALGFGGGVPAWPALALEKGCRTSRPPGLEEGGRISPPPAPEEGGRAAPADLLATALPACSELGVGSPAGISRVARGPIALSSGSGSSCNVGLSSFSSFTVRSPNFSR